MREEKRGPILCGSTPLSCIRLGLNIRVEARLRAKYTTLAQLRAAKNSELLAIPGFGHEALRKVWEVSRV